MSPVEAQDKRDKCCGELLSNADADGYVAATFLPVGDVGVGIDLEIAFSGRILVNEEGHGFWGARLLLKLFGAAGAEYRELYLRSWAAARVTMVNLLGTLSFQFAPYSARQIRFHSCGEAGFEHSILGRSQERC